MVHIQIAHCETSSISGVLDIERENEVSRN